MTIKTELQLQKDGYFKEIKLKKEGKNEWLEDQYIQKEQQLQNRRCEPQWCTGQKVKTS